MKLVTYRTEGATRIGAIDPTQGLILDFLAASGGNPIFRAMLDLIDVGSEGLDLARRIASERMGDPEVTISANEVRLLAPLPDPRQIRDFSVFPGHILRAPQGMQKIAARMRGETEEKIQAIQPIDNLPDVYAARPVYYITNRHSIGGPEDHVLWPGYSQLMDFELEYAIVLGKSGRNISRSEARSHIFGYMIYNDFSARDSQLLEMAGMLGPTKGKSFDGGNVFGPWLVTPDELPDANALEMTARVNGAVWGSGNSRDMLFHFEDMIAYVSRDETLHAGEVFGSGTVGFGCGLEVDRYLHHGDLVELEVEHLGRLRNRVLRSDQPWRQVDGVAA